MNNLIADLLKDRRQRKSTRKSMATVELARREAAASALASIAADMASNVNDDDYGQEDDELTMLNEAAAVPKKKFHETYAEFYLKTKRSGSLAVPVSEYSEEQRCELVDLFNLYDGDKDNKLGVDDLMRIFSAVNPKEFTRDKCVEFIKSASNYGLICFKIFFSI